MRLRTRVLAAWAIFLALGTAPLWTSVSGQAQVPPPSLAEALYRLPVYLRILYTAAHPDDENNPLLVYLSRQLFARTAYLSATRGDGGQNLIGNELGEALGVLRTEELLAAQRVEAVDQYFTRAYDFGFTRSAQETLSKWGHDEILSDFVRIIRRFRPDIIISRFTGAPGDGHGQHQAAGMLTKEAFKAAGDPARFTEQFQQGLQPWQARKLFLNRGRFSDSTTGVGIDLGLRSPSLGQSSVEIGDQARNLHRSQFLPRTPRTGSSVTVLQLIDAVPPSSVKGDESGLTAGMNTSLTRIADFAEDPPLAERLRTGLALVEKEANEAVAAFRSNDRPGVIASLRPARRRLISLLEANPMNFPAWRYNVNFALRQKLHDFDAAIILALDLEVTAHTATMTAAPGDPCTIKLTVRNGSALPLKAAWVGTLFAWHDLEGTARPLHGGSDSRSAPGNVAENGLPGERPGPRYEIPAGAVVVKELRERIPEDAPATEPYWLRRPRIGDRFQVDPPDLIGYPQAPAPLRLRIRISLGDPTSDALEIVSDVLAVPPSRDRLGQPSVLRVVPELSVIVSPPILLASPSSQDQIKRVHVELFNQTSAAATGTVELKLPKGWISEPRQSKFTIDGRRSSSPLPFQVRIPPGTSPASYSIQAIVNSGPKVFTRTQGMVGYLHVNTNYLYRPAEALAGVFDFKIPPNISIGYISGHGDLLLPSLRALGVLVSEIDTWRLENGNLVQFDCILIGPRAYESREDLALHNGRLLDYVREGGTLIVQYQVASFNDKGFSPYPLRIAGEERVTDERAAVRVLDPNHPIFTYPNPITDRDFADWVQERGLYFAASWDEKAFKPLLESHDNGERERLGGMLIADYGRGHYIYTAYAWFRQLPAGVPGAYRLFANLLSYPQAPGRN
ncbi:MAG: PIG-L family deacetylase [Acidobacteria bacterium]|nr:PIG-L family deacetylase [Acidobacteriota bacterium]